MSLQTPAALKHDSTNSEPNSNTKGFINDIKVPINSIAPNAKAVYLAALNSFPAAAEMARGANAADNKENMEP